MNCLTRKSSLLAIPLVALVLTACPGPGQPGQPLTLTVTPAGTSQQNPAPVSLQNGQATLSLTASATPSAGTSFEWAVASPADAGDILSSSTGATVTATFTQAATYQIVVTARNTSASPASRQATIWVAVTEGTTPPPTELFPLPLAEGAILINAGSDEATTIGDVTFQPDTGLFEASVATGNAFISTNPITLPEGYEAFAPIFQTERNTGLNDQSSTLTYTIDAPNGTYDVYLLFAELFYGVEGTGGANLGAGARVFNASVQGTDLLTDYDVFVQARPSEDASGALIGITEVAEGVTVADGEITIALTSVVNRAKVNGIIILPASE